jgi:Na+/H+ antiporter NhaD/arsenite permease-like protein
MTGLVVAIFVLGYLAITLEHVTNVNKAAVALLTAVISWTVIVYGSDDPAHLQTELGHHLSKASEILFFLLGAMTIVELIDAHDGFQVITERIRSGNLRKLTWLLSSVTFVLSAILDNLTTTIVMMSILNKMIDDRKTKWLLLGLVIISANAGGAWSPIGDVTTTMLWIGGQISPSAIVASTLLASLVCMVIPTFLVASALPARIVLKEEDTEEGGEHLSPPFERNLVFALGLASLLFVPVFKVLTGLPPYMGMLLSLGVMWVITEFVHADKDEAEKGLLSVNHALRKIDTPSILFFLGILLSIAALEAEGILPSLAASLDEKAAGNLDLLAIGIGFLSSVFDNVPLVAALQGMYTLEAYPTDHYFWQLLAYCAGTGGSCLIIGSAAGVAVMGIEKIDFFWYLKKVSWLAAIGYLAGAAVFLLQRNLAMAV